MKKSVIFLWAAIAVIFGFFWIYFPALSHYRDLKLEEERISRELTELDAKIEALKEERGLLKNDVGYLEKVIHEELGLVKPGEIIYKFVPAETKKPDNQALLPPSSSLKPPAPPAGSQETNQESR